MSIDACDPRTDKEAAWLAFHRIRNKIRKSTVLRREWRRAACEETNHRCCYCGVALIDVTDEIIGQLTPRLRYRCATLEHIIRKADGGTDQCANLTAACYWCNTHRNDLAALLWFSQVQWLKERGQHPNFP